MARPVTLSTFQRMQTGEIEANGDAEMRTSNAAAVDPLTGGVVAADTDEDAARLKAIGAGTLTYDVALDGTVAGVRPAETTPDRGDVSQHHTVGEDGQRFSGAGAEDGPEPSGLVPNDAAFNGRLYREAPELANLAEQLISEHGHLQDLVNCQILYFWRRKTGVSKGRVKIGFCKRLSDLLGHFSGAEFAIWLSATTARDGKFTSKQVEAALFHQLCHLSTDDEGNWIKVPHDFEGFAAEIRHYGTWTEDLRLGGTAFVASQQMGLWELADDEDEDDEGEEIDERGDVLAKYRPADPDKPYDDEDLEDLPTGEEIDAERAALPEDADLPFG